MMHNDPMKENSAAEFVRAPDADCGTRKAGVLRSLSESPLNKWLRKQGYEFDHEHGNSEEKMEVWVNRKTGRGIAIEWFTLPEVGA